MASKLWMLGQPTASVSLIMLANWFADWPEFETVVRPREHNVSSSRSLWNEAEGLAQGRASFVAKYSVYSSSDHGAQCSGAQCSRPLL
eukprot:4264405-Amphidinium_carterae.2